MMTRGGLPRQLKLPRNDEREKWIATALKMPRNDERRRKGAMTGGGLPRPKGLAMTGEGKIGVKVVDNEGKIY